MRWNYTVYTENRDIIHKNVIIFQLATPGFSADNHRAISRQPAIGHWREDKNFYIDKPIISSRITSLHSQRLGLWWKCMYTKISNNVSYGEID